MQKDAVSAEQVAMAVERAMKAEPFRGRAVNIDGASRSAALLLEALEIRNAGNLRRESSI